MRRIALLLVPLLLLLPLLLMAALNVRYGPARFRQLVWPPVATLTLTPPALSPRLHYHLPACLTACLPD